MATTPWLHLPHARLLSDSVPRARVVVAAFEGWNDAGDAATTAARYLINRWSARPALDLDPEPFYDFTSARPIVQLSDAGHRSIHWPENRFFVSPSPSDSTMVLLGIEPGLRWRTFCDHVIGVASSVGATMVVTLGALLAEVPHTRPTRVYGTAEADELAAELSLERSTYEGPTGIVGALGAAVRDAGLASVSIWAAVPSYVPNAPSPKAALALVDRLSALLSTSIPTVDLQLATAAYERQVTELVSEDDDTTAYVQGLEQHHDDETSAKDTDLVAEVERFLRDQN